MNPKEVDLFCFENVIYLNLKRLLTIFSIVFFFVKQLSLFSSHCNLMFCHSCVKSTSLCTTCGGCSTYWCELLYIMYVGYQTEYFHEVRLRPR